MIRKKDGKWLLYTRDGSRVLGTHPTQERAMAQERAILMRQHMAKQGRSEAAGEIPGQKPGLRKRAEGISFMAVPEGLLYEAASGDPRSAAELKRLEEAHARRIFSLGSEGRIRSILAKALLGRTRTEGATTEVERKLLESRPELSRLSASARPEKSYPVSRAVTTPALAAIPAGGVGALLARLVAQAAGASPAEREIATAAGAGLGGVAGSMAAYGLRQHHAKQLGRWLHEKDLADRQAARLRSLVLQAQQEGDVPREGRIVTASINVPDLIPHFLDSLSMIKEGRGLLRLFGLGGARATEQAAARALEQSALRGAERAALRGAAEAEGRAVTRAGSRTLPRIGMSRADVANEFRRVAQALPEGDPRRLILESEVLKMTRQMPARPRVPGGIRMQELEPGAIAPTAEGMIAAPGQEVDFINALAGETEQIRDLRRAGRLSEARIPASPRMVGELADLQAELTGVGLPLSGGRVPRGTLVPFEEVEGAILPSGESLLPGYGSSILPAPPVSPGPAIVMARPRMAGGSPLPAAPPVSPRPTIPLTQPQLAGIAPTIPLTQPQLAGIAPTIPATQPQLAGIAPTLQAPIPGARTEILAGARSPGRGGVQQLVTPFQEQMGIPTERLSAQGLIPSEYFRLKDTEPIFPFAGPGPLPGRQTMQLRAILPQTASQPISTAELIVPQI